MFAKSSTVLHFLKRAGVVRFTLSSVHCADSITATTNSKGFEKSLEAVGVGYRFNVQGKKITINAGYSNPVVVEVPEGLTVEMVSNTEITIKGIDKQKVAEFAANVRKVRTPEPYKGKGIRYKGEHVRRKEGKKAAK